MKNFSDLVATTGIPFCRRQFLCLRRFRFGNIASLLLFVCFCCVFCRQFVLFAVVCTRPPAFGAVPRCVVPPVLLCVSHLHRLCGCTWCFSVRLLRVCCVSGAFWCRVGCILIASAVAVALWFSSRLVFRGCGVVVSGVVVCWVCVLACWWCGCFVCVSCWWCVFRVCCVCSSVCVGSGLCCSVRFLVGVVLCPWFCSWCCYSSCALHRPVVGSCVFCSPGGSWW